MLGITSKYFKKLFTVENSSKNGVINSYIFNIFLKIIHVKKTSHEQINI